jgi:YesN/AraC family two-component response regulator
VGATVLLVDNDSVIRKGTRLLVEEEEDIRVVGEAEYGREAIEPVVKLSPDIVIMDIAMPDHNGIDATRRILSEFRGTQ